MFNSVSWHEYLTSVLFFLIIYYGYLVISYFRNDLKISRHYPTKRTPNDTGDLFREDEEHALLFSAVHDLMEELREVFDKASDHKYQKEGLLMALQPKLSKYKNLKGTALQVSVNNHILRQSQQVSIEVEEDDLKNMW